MEVNLNNVPAQRKCLLIECCLWHEETLLHWVRLLHSLGYAVSIYSSRETLEENALHLGSLTNFTLHRISNSTRIDTSEYDFVVMNTLLHEGYYFPLQDIPSPTIHFIRKLNLPSISVIHEPQLWIDIRLENSFDLVGPAGLQTLYLFTNQRWMKDAGRYGEGHWRGAGNTLTIPLEDVGTDVVFESHDGGDTYHSLANPAQRLIRKKLYTLHDHLDAGRNVVIALTPQGVSALDKHYLVTDWIMPVYFGDFEPAAAHNGLVIPGEVNYDRKHFAALFKAAEEVRALENDRIYIMGGQRGFIDSGQVRAQNERLQSDIRTNCLSDKITVTGYLPYAAYYRRIQASRFILPLVDECIDSGTYLSRMSAAIAQSIAFGVPMILNERIARLFGLEFMICYRGDDLASGLEAYRTLGESEYLEMRRLTACKRASFDAYNVATLQRLINRISPKSHASAAFPAHQLQK